VSHGWVTDVNAAGLEITLAATDLVARANVIGTATVLVAPVPLLAVAQLGECA
jgi:hypothetical protein